MDKSKLCALPPRADVSGNRILDAFLREDRTLRACIEAVRYDTGHELYQQEGPMSHVYFPVTGVVSLVIRMRSGRGAEVATIGNEGLVGLPLVFGIDTSFHSVLQQAPGELFCMPATRFRAAVQSSAYLQSLMGCFSAYMLRFTQQTAACNALHPLIARACRWLLLAHDRAGGQPFIMTQSMLADMLGVRRPSVSEVAARLHRVGLIEYSRGLVTVVDRKKLEAAACECYRVVTHYYNDVFGQAVRTGRRTAGESVAFGTLKNKRIAPR